MSTYFRVFDGVRVRFADTRADSDTTVLMLALWPGKPVGLPSHLGPHHIAREGCRPRHAGDSATPISRLSSSLPMSSGAFLALHLDQWGLGAPHIVGPDVGTAAALFLVAKPARTRTSLTIGGGAAATRSRPVCALKDTIEAPSLDDVRGLDARTNIGYTVQPAAPSDTEPEVHEDYVKRIRPRPVCGSRPGCTALPPSRTRCSGSLPPTITTPTQIVAGRNDEPCRGRTTSILDQLLPAARSPPSRRRYFAWEQAAEETARWSPTGSAAGIVGVIAGTRRRRKLEMVLPGVSPARTRCQRHRSTSGSLRSVPQSHTSDRPRVFISARRAATAQSGWRA